MGLKKEFKELFKDYSIPPIQLSEITGSITDCPLDGGTPSNILDSTLGRVIAEFVIIARD